MSELSISRTAYLARKFSESFQHPLTVRFSRINKSLLALAIGYGVAHLPPPTPLDHTSMLFLATMAAGITLLALEVFDEYVVALMMLTSWLFMDILPPKLAVAGFAKSSWFFILGAFGIAAAVNKTGILRRGVDVFLEHVPWGPRLQSFALGFSGLFATPVLPSVKARMAIVSPLAQAMSDRFGFASRSNGSASLSLACFVGYSQLTFMFLTGANSSFVAWSVLPEPARLEFGWSTWLLAALPGGVFFFLLMFGAILFFFPSSRETPHLEATRIAHDSAPHDQTQEKHQGITLLIVSLAIVGWVTKPFHGMSEAWVSLAALTALFVAGVLNKKTLTNNIDWGFLIFFGVVYSLAGALSHLKIDQWLTNLVGPLVTLTFGNALAFLTAVLVAVYLVRFFLAKTPAVILMSVALMPAAQDLGIHPGVFALTVLLGVDIWFLPHQMPSYIIAYKSSEGRAFSHAQGRKLLAAKCVASILTLAVSVPYWSLLGFIEPSASRAHAARSVTRAVSATAVAPETPGSHGPGIAEVQTILSRLGYEPGPRDGIFGPRTRHAIRSYQKTAGLHVDGIPSAGLLDHLRLHQSLVFRRKGSLPERRRRLVRKLWKSSIDAAQKTDP